MNFLSGKKTYVIAILMVVTAAANTYYGDMTIGEFLKSAELKTLLEAFGLSSLRAGVSKSAITFNR
jgi:hypothetical protein